MAEPRPLLLLVDGHSLAFRSFYAFAKGGDGGLATKDGVPTSVTYGFLKSLLDTCAEWKPDGVAIAFDTDTPTFRHEADETYKANRDVAPEQFFADLDNLRQILADHLDLPLVMAPGYEADDVLGTLADRAAAEGWRVRILSGDRDLFQLVDDNRDIAVLYMGGGPRNKGAGPREIRREGVVEKLGVPPEDVVDLKALTGDSSDNIPGVRGVGPKTAITLLQAHGSLTGIYDALEQQKGALRTKLTEGKDSAFRSRMLAAIHRDVPLPEAPRLSLGQVRLEPLRQRLADLELFSLLRQAERFADTFSNETLAEAPLAEAPRAEAPRAEAFQGEAVQSELFRAELPPGEAPPASARPLLEPLLIQSPEGLEQLRERLLAHTAGGPPVAVDTETTSLNPFRAELVGLGVCWGEGPRELAYIPIGHRPEAEAEDPLPEPKDPFPSQLPLDSVLLALGPWLGSADHPKALQNAKYDRLILLRHGLPLAGVVMDTLLADYLRDPADRHNLEAMAQREFGFTPASYDQVVGKKTTFAAVAIPAAAQYCGMDVHLTWRLSGRLGEALAALGPALPALLREVELPLEPVLAAMEATGIRIDQTYLQELSRELAGQLEHLEAEAQRVAGQTFNLASPKQLEALLFDTLSLDRKKSRKTKTGFSTDAATLEKLEDDHPVVPLLIQHRILSKLRSTYVDALPALVEPETGRVHTDFNQAVTATGRLSSSNPNLQNIPIRTEFSRRIRKAFLPEEGWWMISADYSQIELRILAHLSGEEVLIEAYNAGDDVHALTARLLLEKEEVSADERRLGKTINFGVIYGMGPQRLARETGLSQARAKEFLQRFKERYTKVFAFLELQERLALSRGWVETLLGRRRTFHFDPGGLGRHRGKDPLEISLESARRGGLEAQQLRAAANAPIQGSSADIIKLAMVRLQGELNQRRLAARLLLQVHDELVLEAAPDVLEEVRALTRRTMEEVIQLRVPLVVDTGVGANWMDTK
ncbi:MAG: DNA polymerase I [Cyanobacteria bacterium K_Offshore_surface_m2_239]|nr:DNA polymerase I [Cyanobacteria bacterium K_Offshore_surface_m2_239]